ncbi:ABC transporter ATP-binding protein [Azospirillum sp. sgz302134]
MTDDRPLLEVENLRISFPTRTGMMQAVRGVSFTVGREKLGIVGESGSGKSMTGRAILRLVPAPGLVTADRLSFQGEDLLAASDKRLRDIRGRRISMVMQDPKFSLNPVMTVGRQIAEAYRVHTRAGKAEARQRALEMLEAVRIRNPERVYDLYPHEVSGGMGQRIMIAMMLIPNPDLLIADEPTSALDVTVQMQVLAIMDELCSSRGMGLIFISHDLNLVASFCDRILIMYAGRVVETCRASELHNAKHPYTRGLLDSLPRLDDTREQLPVLTRDPAWLEDASPSPPWGEGRGEGVALLPDVPASPRPPHPNPLPGGERGQGGEGGL